MLLIFSVSVVHTALNHKAYLELSVLKTILRLLLLLVIGTGFFMPQALTIRRSSALCFCVSGTLVWKCHNLSFPKNYSSVFPFPTSKHQELDIFIFIFNNQMTKSWRDWKSEQEFYIFHNDLIWDIWDLSYQYIIE